MNKRRSLCRAVGAGHADKEEGSSRKKKKKQFNQSHSHMLESTNVNTTCAPTVVLQEDTLLCLRLFWPVSPSVSGVPHSCVSGLSHTPCQPA
jgi:hypothetical protein